jgi:hypothetical protein
MPALLIRMSIGPELAPDAVDHRLDVGSHRDVALDGHRAAAFRSHVVGDRAGLRADADVVDRHVGAFVREDFRDPPADPAARTRHERDLVLQSHEVPPTIFRLQAEDSPALT